MRTIHRETNGKQPGNPEVTAQKVVAIARLENLTSEKKRNLPLRIPLGTDAVGIMRLKCTQTLENLHIWESFAASTDLADALPAPSNYR